MSSVDDAAELDRPQLGDFDPWFENEKAALLRWKSDSARLFSEPDEVRVVVVDVGQSSMKFSIQRVTYTHRRIGSVVRNKDALTKALLRTHERMRLTYVVH